MISFLALAGFPGEVLGRKRGLILLLALWPQDHVNKGGTPSHRADKKMLASKTKRTYFEGANNSTPFFALVMPTGATPEYCFAE